MSIETLVKISTSLNASLDYILMGYTHYMESILAKEAVETYFKDGLNEEIKEILDLLSGCGKDNLRLINDMIKLLLPHIKK